MGLGLIDNDLKQFFYIFEMFTLPDTFSMCSCGLFALTLKFNRRLFIFTTSLNFLARTSLIHHGASGLRKKCS